MGDMARVLHYLRLRSGAIYGRAKGLQGYTISLNDLKSGDFMYYTIKHGPISGFDIPYQVGYDRITNIRFHPTKDRFVYINYDSNIIISSILTKAEYFQITRDSKIIQILEHD
jgi:hypothetical protein